MNILTQEKTTCLLFEAESFLGELHVENNSFIIKSLTESGEKRVRMLFEDFSKNGVPYDFVEPTSDQSPSGLLHMTLRVFPGDQRYFVALKNAIASEGIGCLEIPISARSLFEQMQKLFTPKQVILLLRQTKNLNEETINVWKEIVAEALK